MTEEELDVAMLTALASLIDPDGSHLGAAKLFRQMWADRTAFLEVLVAIRDWDLHHSEALSARRAIQLATDAVAARSDA
jgi:hypothetical protein